MTYNNEQYEKGPINDMYDDITDKNANLLDKKIIYSLLGLIIILSIWGLILLFFLSKKNDETKKNNEIFDDAKKNAEIVNLFFKDGYENSIFDKVMTYMAENYYDHSPASARSNAQAVDILKIVQKFFSYISVEMLDLKCEKDMVAARISFKVFHTGEYNEIPSTRKTITYEALENHKVVNGKIVESWEYWPDNQIEEKLRTNSILI